MCNVWREGRSKNDTAVNCLDAYLLPTHLIKDQGMKKMGKIYFKQCIFVTYYLLRAAN